MNKARYKNTFILCLFLAMQLSCSYTEPRPNIPNFVSNNKSYSVINSSPS